MLKCKVNTKEFQEALKKLNKYKVKSDLKILDTIKITITDDKLQLMRTDLENYITITIDNVRIVEADTIIIKDVKEVEKSFKFMKEYLTEIESDKDNNIIINNGNRNIKIKGEDPKEYPEFPNNIKINNSYTYNTKILYNRLKKINFTRSNDNCRPLLTGIHFNESDIVALDGYRMAVDTDYNLRVEEPFTINSEFIDFLLKTLNRKKELNLNFTTEDRYIVVNYDNITIISSLLEGKYFDYEAILPKDYQEIIEVSTKKFKDDIDFLSIYTKDVKNELTELITENNILKLKVSGENGIFETETKIDNNSEISIAFDNKYMKEALKEVEGKQVDICYNGSYNPLILEDNSTKFMILPIKTKTK